MSFTLSSNNGSIFTDSSLNDVILRSTTLNKNILLGTGINNQSKLVINQNGIGIGTTSPLEVLDVRGNIIVSQNQYILGNVGIGTTNTQANKLYILGDSYTSGTVRSSNVFIEGDLIVMGNTSIINTDVKITDQFVVSNAGFDTAVIIKQTGDQNSIEVYDDDKLAFLVANLGKVGINTDNPQAYFHVVGDSLYDGDIVGKCNMELKGNLTCDSNIGIIGKLTCNSINNVLLKYDVPDVIISTKSSDTLKINLTLGDIIHDDDGFGNIIPNIDKLYVSYSNNVLGSNIVIASNLIKNIKYVNVYSGNENPYYNTTFLSNDTFNMYGLVSHSNYNISLYYKNSRGQSVNNVIASNVSTLQIGTPSVVQNMTASIVSSNIEIGFTTPLYTDSLNNSNLTSIKDYKLIYQAVNSIRYNNVIDIYTQYSTSNSFKIENYDSVLYIGTIYKLSVYPKNISLDTYGTATVKYIYTGINSNNFIVGDSLDSIPLVKQNSTSNYNYNTYYSIDAGSNSSNSSIVSNDSNLLMSSLNSFYQETSTSNLRLYYNPNPQTSNNGTITSILTVTSNNTQILDTVSLIIKAFNSNNSNVVSNNSNVAIQLKSINTQNSTTATGTDKLSNYFLKSKLAMTINYNSNVSGNKINYGYNKYSLNTKINLNEFTSWYQPDTSNISFNSTLCNAVRSNGNITQNYYYDNFATVGGSPSLTNFGYTISNVNKIMISGIPTGSNYNLDYAVNLSNVGNYWVINPIISIQNSSNNSNIFKNTITTSNKYYTNSNGNNLYNNSNYSLTKNYITEINKATLSNGLSSYNYKILFKETQNIVMTSNVLLSNIDISMVGYNILGNTTSNISIGLIHYDSNSLNHSHISIQNSNDIYGIRRFTNTSNVLTYPLISTITSYDNSSNISLGNYVKDTVLFNGYYYGENTTAWKKNFTTIDSNGYNYSNLSIANTRYTLIKYSNINGSTTDLSLNIVENSHDDKIIYVKYEIVS